MKLFQIFSLLSFFYFTATQITAQTMQISGTVYDTSGTVPLKNALAMTVRISDSLLLDYTRTDAQGHFSFPKHPMDTFTLILSFPKLEDKSYFIFGNPENLEIDIKHIKMVPKNTELEEVVIYANKNPIYYNGDTLVYVADSFKVQENAVVEDLLKKLPGITVDENGKIQSQGKEINQVLVDGDEFFGSDATIATKNLAAKGLKSVQVYEKVNENSTEGENETIQVMDLRLKEEAKKGYFGKASLASDFQQYHMGEFLFNKFDKSRKISVFMLGSTTPESTISRADMRKFGLGGGRDFTENEDGVVEWGNGDNPSSGIPRAFTAGIYYTDKLGKNKEDKIVSNYSYTRYELTTSSASRSQYFLTDSTYFSDDSSRNVNLDERHRLNITYENVIDSLTKFSIKPNLTYSKSNSDSYTETINSNSPTLLNLLTNINNVNQSDGLDLNNDFIFTRKFMKPTRELKIKYNYQMANEVTKGNLLSNNIYYQQMVLNDTTDQEKYNQSISNSHVTKLSYTEPLGKKFRVEFEYLYERNASLQKNESKNLVGETYSEIDSTFTSIFDNLKQQHRLSTIFTFQTRIHTLTIGVRARNVDMINDNLFLGTSIHQNVNNLFPKATYLYKPSQNKRFKINYYSRSSLPSSNDLLPVQNNTNPNRIIQGNPDLLPSYSHNAQITFNTWQALTGRYIWMSLNSSITNNSFANATTYDDFGRTISQTVNVDGNTFIGFFLGGGIPIYKKIVKLEPGLNATQSVYQNFINSVKNTTTNRNLSADMELNFTWDSLFVELGGKFDYTAPKSTISSVSNTPYSTSAASIRIEWTMPGKMKFVTDATYNINSRRANGYNINFLIWNASLQRSFLQTQNLVLSVMANDILNQNVAANRNVSGNIITDYKTVVISRYFLVKLLYKFNNNKTKEEDAQWGWH
jgi:hypothetical protein